MKKYNYQKYDYSFLKPKNSWYESLKKAYSKTIGFDLVNTKPMSEPTGRLCYMDYEPVRDNNGTFTITFTAPSPSTYIRNYDDFVKAYTTTSNYVNEWSKRGRANYIVTSSNVAKMFK